VRRPIGNSGSGGREDFFFVYSLLMERGEERRVEAEELGAGGEKQPLFLPMPHFVASAEEEDLGDGWLAFFCSSLCHFSFCLFFGALSTYPVGTGLGGGQRELATADSG